MPEVPQVMLREAGEQEGAVAQPGSPEIPPKQDDSRYQLLGEIARGGMGAIIKGRDSDLGRDLAIKVLLDSHKGKPEVVERFIEEAQIGGQLQHPGIVPVYELGQFADERPFFSMKLVKGKTLASLLGDRANPSQDLAQLLGIFEQVCQTMAYAHSRGVIHRDLKPANIMVGAFGEVQVMDWGLAKVLAEGGVADEQKALNKQRDISIIQTRRSTGSDAPAAMGSQTHMGSVMGTPAYMPPEQALGEIDRLDERADVFGLGAILCEILTGKPPYVGEDGTQVFRLASRGKLDECFARLEESGVDEELVVLVTHALAAEPDDRLRDAGSVTEGVTHYLTGVQERLKEAQLESAKAQTRRKLSVAIAALMLVIAIGSGWAAANFRRQREVQAKLATEKTVLADQNAELAEGERKAREEAERQLKTSTVMRLAAQARIIRDGLPVQSLLLSIEAVELARQLDPSLMPLAHETLQSGVFATGGQPLGRHDGRLGRLALSANDRWLVTSSQKSPARLWDLWATDLESASKSLGGDHGNIGMSTQDSRRRTPVGV
jgi:serine/threonine protein kinase